MRPGAKVVPWLYLSLVWCSTFHCRLPGASSNKSTTKHSWAEWHIGGTGETPPDPPPGPRWSWADAAATFLLGESQELPTYLQAKSGAREEGNATQSLHPRSVEGCTCMHSWDGCTETTYAWLQGAQTHTHGHAGTYNDGSHNSPALRATAHSLGFTSPSPACKGWDVSLPQTLRQGLCRVHSRSPAGTAWPPLQLCPRNQATFAPLFLPVATTSPPKHLNGSGLV